MKLDFVDRGLVKNMNTDHLTHIQGEQPAEQAGSFFRATTARKQYSSTDGDAKPA